MPGFSICILRSSHAQSSCHQLGQGHPEAQRRDPRVLSFCPRSGSESAGRREQGEESRRKARRVRPCCVVIPSGCRDFCLPRVHSAICAATPALLCGVQVISNLPLHCLCSDLISRKTKTESLALMTTGCSQEPNLYSCSPCSTMANYCG